MRNTLFILFCLPLFSPVSQAIEGPIKDFGLTYDIPDAQAISPDTRFKIAFDVAEKAEPGQLNFNINSLARFINMHVKAGVPAENIELALVVHGSASVDMLDSKHYMAQFDAENKTQALIEQLLKHQTHVYLCGQSAAYYQVNKNNMIEGVTLALSAMTVHAQLQQAGFTLNPF